MRAILQRVSSAKVVINEKISGEIGPGLMILLGITHQDSQEDVNWMIKKITQLRIFNDAEDKMNLSVVDTGGDLLVVSQFTLYANAKKGNRPSYTDAAPPATAIPLYETFLSQLRASFPGKVATGEFGASMQVSLVNEGPVTIILDSSDR
ncbi:MAG: D-aminoacyl-tRNA deacylase [Bacteroidia bacterium]